MERRLSRRGLIRGSAATALVLGCGIGAPAPRRPRRIGWLSSGATPPPTAFDTFREGMRTEGFAWGEDYVLEPRSAGQEGLVAAAKELVAVDPALILAVTTGATQAALSVTSTVPIVMVAAHDPVEARVVTSLSQPGGNVTGQSLMGGDLMPKQLEILGEVAPFRRLAYLTPHVPSPAEGFPSVTDVFERSMREKAAAIGVEVVVSKWSNASDLPAMVSSLETAPVDAVFVIESATWLGPPPRPIDRVVTVASRRRLPSISGQRIYAEAGLLIAYGDARTPAELMRSVTGYAAKILRGAKPGDLPIDRPTRFDLVVNAKAAEAIGVTLPRTLLERASVIQ